MLKAKLLAMCVCPAVLAPPAIIAVHKPARHAVAHLLQRAALRLDDRVAAPSAAPVVQYANIPCAPTLADAGGAAVPSIGGVGLASLVPEGAIYGDASHPGGGIGFGGGGGFIGGGGGGGTGGSGGGGVTTPGLPGTPLTTPPPAGGGIGGMTPPSTGATMGSVPEPATWALLVTGFGVVGAGLRYKRILTA